MSEFMYDKEKYIKENEKIIFENNTDSSFGVETGIIFHKSGLYNVDISNNHVVVSKVDERKTIEEAYQKGYDTGQHEVTTLEYQQGLDDAWETITKIASIPYAKRSEIFDGQQDILSIVQKFSPSEAIDKLREYEQQKLEIKVGDEVEAFCGRAIVFGTSTDKKGNKFCQYWYPSADRFDKDKIANLKKTGRYFPQVAELLKVIKSEQRDCHTCKHPDSIECVDCRRFGRWQPKEGVE